MQRTFGTIFLALAVAVLSGTAAGAGDIQTDGALVSTATSGPPLVVSSSDLVANLNADTVDGLHATDLATKLGNVVTVAATGGDFTSIGAANASITDAGASNPYLVEIAPGTYSESSFAAKSHVHYRGSGEGVTTLEGTGGVSVMTAQSNSTITDLTLSNAAVAGTTFTANGASGVAVRRTTISSMNGDGTAFNPVEITNSASVDFREVTVLAAASGNAQVRGVLVDGSTADLRDLVVDVVTNDGNVHGVRVLNDSTVTVDGGTIDLFTVSNGVNFGIFADGTGSATPDVTVNRVTISIEALTSDNRGVLARGAELEIAQSFIEVEKGTNNRGVQGNQKDGVTSVTVRDCSIVAKNAGSGTDVGIMGFGSSTSSETITVFDSQIEAADNVASAASNWTINLIRSHLDGGAMGGGGTVECRYVTNESFGASSTTCPS